MFCVVLLLLKGFVEVSEGEEVPDSDNLITKSEQLPEISNKEEVVKSSPEESQENDSSDSSPSLNSSKVEEQEAESSGDTSATPAPGEWDNIDVVDLDFYSVSLYDGVIQS